MFLGLVTKPQNFDEQRMWIYVQETETLGEEAEEAGNWIIHTKTVPYKIVVKPLHSQFNLPRALIWFDSASLEKRERFNLSWNESLQIGFRNSFLVVSVRKLKGSEWVSVWDWSRLDSFAAIPASSFSEKCYASPKVSGIQRIISFNRSLIMDSIVDVLLK